MEPHCNLWFTNVRVSHLSRRLRVPPPANQAVKVGSRSRRLTRSTAQGLEPVQISVFDKDFVLDVFMPLFVAEAKPAFAGAAAG